MAIGRITGPMLQSNLDRQGINLQVDTDLAYFDVTNRRLGIGTTLPAQSLDVPGNVRLAGLLVLGNTITSNTGKIGLGSISNIVITGGANNSLVSTDGNGNLSFVTINSIITSVTGNNVILGTNTAGSLNSALTFSQTTTTATDAIAKLNQLLGTITNSNGNAVTVTGTVTASNTVVTGTTNATNQTTGALTVAGGASIQKDLWVGGNVYASSIVSANISILSVTDPLLYLTASNPYPYNYETGFFSHFIGGATNTYQHTGFVRNHLDNTWYLFSNAAEPVGSNVDLSNISLIYDSLKMGGATVVNTTPSTSTTTGALVVSGGAGIAGALCIANTGDVSANIGSVLGSIEIFNANLGAYQTYANAISTTQESSINSINANVGLYAINTDANIGTLYNHINTLDANVGAYENTTNANIGTLYSNNISINANLGAYQTYANIQVSAIDANLGAYQTYANATSNTITTSVDIVNANLGAYQTYANANAAAQSTLISTLQSEIYSNANVQAYLPVYSGNLNPANLITSAIYVDNIYSDSAGVVTIALNTAFGLPLGGNIQRPSSPGLGQIRFNTEIDALEVYGGTGWVSLNNTISGQDFFGDGVNTTYTLNSATNATGILVSINGTVQQPGVAYAVNGDQIIFAEVPQETDQIDVRFLASAVSATYNNIDIDTGAVPVYTVPTIIDSFNANVYRSVKYVISSTSLTDAHMAEVGIVQFNGILTSNTTGNINTSSNTITYTANINGSIINLLAQGTTTSSARIQRIYFSI